MHYEQSIRIPVALIDRMIHSRQSRLLSGAAVGTLAGVAVGAIVGSEMSGSSPWGGLQGGAAAGYCILGGLTVGAIVGAVPGMDDVLDFSGKSVSAKMTDIHAVILKEGDE